MSWPVSETARSRRCRRFWPWVIVLAMVMTASAFVVGFTGLHLAAMVGVIFAFVGIAIDSSPRSAAP
ncbi:MAG: hypothetical protein J7474_11485 [Arthrobacter sp.]|nr:hypothetical protein [Arthrobacter sp.]